MRFRKQADGLTVEHNISALGGAAPSNFYTRWGLTKPCERTPQRGRGPPKKFNRENLKFGLKFSVCAPIR